jgi:class 3 adenylate cyclase/CheY-like chemotaxis protein
VNATPGSILVVDDTALNRAILRRALTDQGHEVHEARNGLEALEILAAEAGKPTDIVLLDIEMPEMDGYETLRRIKSDPGLRDLPVIVISAVDELESVVRCIELGATDYLPKPFNGAVLEARIRASLSAKRLRDAELEYLDRQAGTNAVLNVINRSALDLDAVLTAVIEQATRLCRASYGAIYLAEAGRFPVAAAAGDPALAGHERAHPFAAGRDSLVGRVALAAEPVHIADVLADAEYGQHDGQAAGGYRSLLGVPVAKDGRILGVLGFARTEVRPFSASEILLVTAFAEQTGIAIENARLLRTIDRQRTELARFLSPQVGALISSPDGEALLAGHRRPVTAVFCDLRGFTPFSEGAEPAEVLGVLRDYHRAMGEEIVAHGGTLEHFAGDGMLVFFNDPLEQADHVSRAVRMAIAMRGRFDDLRASWAERGRALGFGVGIAEGHATMGRIGFEGRYDYAAIGTVVIMASRLSSDAHAGQILLNRRAYAAVQGEVIGRSVGNLVLKGFSRPSPTFEVTGLRAAGGPVELGVASPSSS